MYIKLFEDNPNTRDILKVVEVLKAGGIIIYPTDTIYAIGCDINNVKAVQRVCQLKNIKPEKAKFFDDLPGSVEYRCLCESK